MITYEEAIQLAKRPRHTLDVAITKALASFEAVVREHVDMLADHPDMQFSFGHLFHKDLQHKDDVLEALQAALNPAGWEVELQERYGTSFRAYRKNG
ncbi:MAG: hypothetical protein E6R04_11425 [Spirochaetes bacterium]|nr:MAG: hypothetical protein E6R04_11425 [Spirochaetota bacterium]